MEKGDTLEHISKENEVPAWKIIYDNQLDLPNRLVPGQALLLLKETEISSAGSGLQVGGYASPFIEPEILMQAFPALGQLFVLSYGFTFEGEIVPPRQDDLWVVEEARKRGTEPVLVLTPFSGGAFNNQLVKVLTENNKIQEKIIDRLFRIVENNGYAGVQLEFEYILPENKVSFAQFVGRVRKRMSRGGFHTSVALAPKVSDTQKGLHVEGLDYYLLGESADFIFLLTCGWGYTYGPPMAVAPADKVREVLEYAVSRIPENKLIMEIPNYGYDWPLPYEKGVTRARTVGNVEAVRIAAENNAQIRYASIARSPWFTYTEAGQIHEVWFEDPRSIMEKLEMAKKFGLGGVAYRNLMRPFRANWLLVGSGADS